MQSKLIIVPKKQKETSLLDFLSINLEISRKKTKKLLDTRNVLVNRKRIWMAHHKLKPGDKIEVIQAEITQKTKVTPRLLFQNDEFIIVDKPAGILSNGKNSIEEQLRETFNIPTLKAVHRLDKDTTGCLLLAKNTKSFKKAEILFRNQKVKKTYNAIIAGRMPPHKKTISTPVGHQKAKTHIKIIHSNNDASHLLVEIKTGRTHQIRKHLLSVKHPIIGDHTYGTRQRLSDQSAKVGRQMLHASTLYMVDPDTKCKISAFAKLPTDFRKCLRMFKLKS